MRGEWESVGDDNLQECFVQSRMWFLVAAAFCARNDLNYILS